MKVLGVNGGNGVILYPFREYLIGNIEPRSNFITPNDVQWHLNFHVPLDKEFRVQYSKVDAIVGAPDCGHSSIFALSRAKKFKNPRENPSLTGFHESVSLYKPKFFLMENLPKLLNVLGKDLYPMFRDYRLIKFIEPVSAWGNSQVNRKRLVLIGVHISIPEAIDGLFKLPPSELLLTEKELIRDLPKINTRLCHVRESDDHMVHMWYEGNPKITIGQAREIWNTEYKELTRWPVEGRNMKTQPGVYKNRANSYPMTVRKSDRQFNSSGYMLSPREIARIQGIPDSFKLWYDPTRHEYCINKARTTCAKTAPYEIGKWFYKCLIKAYSKL